MTGEVIIAMLKKFVLGITGGKIDKPTTAGANGQVLTNDGSGGTKWQTVSEVTNLVVNDDGSVKIVFPDEGD